MDTFANRLLKIVTWKYTARCRCFLETSSVLPLLNKCSQQPRVRYILYKILLQSFMHNHVRPVRLCSQSSSLQNGGVLCFLWCTNWICICYVEEIRPPLWSSGQSSWLQIQRSAFDSQRFHIFWEVVCLERGPLSLVSTTEELLGRKSSVSGLENREYGRSGSASRWLRDTPPIRQSWH
jgi:hypothetical protein